MRKDDLDVRGAAQRLGCTLKYIYDLVYAKRLPAKKVGRQWRIPAAAVEARLKHRGE